LLVTSDSNKIEQAASDLSKLGFEVTAVQSDLSTYDGVEKLWSAIEATGRLVDAIAMNAGIGAYGDFARESDLEEELRLIQLNVTSVVHLAKRVLPQMVARRSGRVLITSSVAGVMPAPLEAVYGASKAFDLSFAQALRAELKDSGVSVTALQPGATNTNFFHRAGMDHTKLGQEGKYSNDPRDVAKQGFEALMKGEDHVFAASLKTKVEGEVAKFVPSSMTAEMHRKQAEPVPPEKKRA
jgi:short-subunit dehydrogenase